MKTFNVVAVVKNTGNTKEYTVSEKELAELFSQCFKYGVAEKVCKYSLADKYLHVQDAYSALECAEQLENMLDILERYDNDFLDMLYENTALANQALASAVASIDADDLRKVYADAVDYELGLVEFSEL